MNRMNEPSYSLIYQDEKDVNECTIDDDCKEREICMNGKCEGNDINILITI